MKNKIPTRLFISLMVKCTGITPLLLGEGIMDTKVFMSYWEQENMPEPTEATE